MPDLQEGYRYFRLGSGLLWRDVLDRPGRLDRPFLTIPTSAVAGTSLHILAQFARWVGEDWDHRFVVFVAINLVLCTSVGLLIARWRPAAWFEMGLFAINLAPTCFALSYLGLFLPFLPTLLPETFAFALSIGAGFNLSDRRRDGTSGWPTGQIAQICVAVVFLSLSAGLYEAYFIHRLPS